jgi:hypothetical protein
VILGGNSAVFGYPLPVEQTFGHLLNDRFAATDVPAHVFNLGFDMPYQLKDAIIVHDALAYAPDVILYPVTLDEYAHYAPSLFPALIRFFDMNGPSVAALLAAPPPTLAEPLEAYRPCAERGNAVARDFGRFEEAGDFMRLVVVRSAERIGVHLGVPAPVPRGLTAGRQAKYDCQETLARFARQYDGWREWDILAYLEELRRTRGIEVVVVNWPIAHEPVDQCYNVRYGARELAEFNDWLRADAARRGLRYIDLHDLLLPEEFLDSVHVSAEGHRRIAERLQHELIPLLRAMAARRAAELRAAR